MKVFDASELGNDWLQLFLKYNSSPARGYNMFWVDGELQDTDLEIYNRLISAGAEHGDTVLVEWDW